MSKPFTLEDLQRWTEEAGRDAPVTGVVRSLTTRPVTLEDLVAGAADGRVGEHQTRFDSSKNNALDSKKQRGQRLGYGAKKRVKP